MKYLSLFSGIGGFELGIQQAHEKLQNLLSSDKCEHEAKDTTIVGQGGLDSKSSTGLGDITCIGFSEIDKYAIQTYQSHFNHTNYGDITKINERELPNFDLLVGGFPCQAFSVAGKRKGFEDTRGTLFFEIARILRAKQPRLLLLENVKGLLSHDNGNTFRTIISTLNELGYDLQWQVLNSKNFGVPQNRERVFIVGHLRGTPRPKVFPFGESNTKDIQQLNNPIHSNDRIYGKDGLAPTLNTMQGGRRQPKIFNPKMQDYSLNDVAGAITATSYKEPPVIAHTIRTGGRSSGINAKQNWDTYEVEGKIRRLTPLECERLQGFPDNWTQGISDTQRYKCCGNAVTVNVISAIMERLITSDKPNI